MYIYIIIILLIIYYLIPNVTMVKKAELFEKKYYSKFIEWKNRCEKIYKLCHLSLPIKIEVSNKMGKNKFNTHRYSVYIDEIPVQNIDSIIPLFNIPVKYQKKIKEDIKINNKEIIYGVDLSCDCGRLYINRGLEKVFAWEWLGNKMTEKNYYIVNNAKIINILTNEYPNIKNNLLKVLPKKIWDLCAIKYINNIPCSIYISLKYSPSLKQLYPNIIPLIKKFYPNYNHFNDWYEHYKDCNLNWLVLTNKNNKKELAIYLNTQGKIIDIIENNLYSFNV
jgi:hypothetical protein